MHQTNIALANVECIKWRNNASSKYDVLNELAI